MITKISALILATSALALWLFLLARGPSDSVRKADAARAVTGGEARAGKRIVLRSGCAGCHDIPGVPVAHGRIGPSLGKFRDQAMIAGVLENSADNLVRWLMDPRKVDPKTAMPSLGLSEREARDVAAYLYAGGG